MAFGGAQIVSRSERGPSHTERKPTPPAPRHREAQQRTVQPRLDAQAAERVAVDAHALVPRGLVDADPDLRS